MTYLPADSITAVRRTPVPRWGYTVAGYTLRRGGPTQYLVRLVGEKVWRRLKVLCFSNNGTLFLTKGGRTYYVKEHEHAELADRR